ncbi:hypothetical protein ACTFIW_009622 [Dictyostelium discoideum]
MKIKIIILIFLKIFFLKNLFVNSLDIGSKCEILNPISMCSNYLSYKNIYLPYGYTQEIIEANVTATLTSPMGFSAIPDLICKENVIKLFCISTYRECNSNINGISFPLPSNPCQKNCYKVLETCVPFLSFFQGFSCQQNDTDGKDLYPITENYYNLTSYGGSSNQSILCSNPNQGSTNTTVSCVYPLVYVSTDDIKNGEKFHEVMPNCVLPCPLYVYTDKQYDAKFYTEVVFYCVSATIAVYLILTFGLIQNKITHRSWIIVYLGFTVLALCASYATQQYGNGDFRCSSQPGRYRSSQDGNCMLTGFFFQMGGLGTIFMLSLYSFDFFLTINMKTNKYFLQTSIGVWALIFFFALLPIKHYESTIDSAGCWIGEYNNRFWLYFCFYIPAYIVTFLMVIFITSSIYKVFKMTVLFKSINDRRILFLNLRSVTFLLVILFCISFTSMYPLYVSYNGEVFYDAIEKWVYCLLEKGNDQCPRIQFSRFGLRYMNAFCMSIIGILLLFGLGIDPHIATIYKESERFNYLLHLVGIKWGNTPVPSKKSSTSSNSSGSSGEKTRETRKTRGQSISLKKIDQSNSNSNEIESSSIDNQPSSILNNNNNNDDNDDKQSQV